MKTRKLLTIFVALMLCLTLSGCLSTSMISKEDNLKKNSQHDYSFLDADSTKTESIDADQVFELMVSDESLKSDTSFSSLGYDVSEDDALLYARSSALMGDSANEYKMLSYLGYEIDEDVLAKAENYSKAKTLIMEGNHTEAFQLLNKDLDYADSKKLAEKMVNEKLVNFVIGDVGPAGGYIFYDKGSYSDGWRYLEAAPYDLSETYEFGGYGTTIGNTSEAVGTGKSNTEAIIKRLGSGTYATKACSDYAYNGYDDWFLPSNDELKLMYTNLHKTGLGNFKNVWYWSSSEDDYCYNAWTLDFDDGLNDSFERIRRMSVRPIRSF